ncbi:MAG: hypothetical protein K0U74_03135 [Alphaproteobacteria bacterium]|nr:hypothetical protein [Alphaproteobacteria bacterium]
MSYQSSSLPAGLTRDLVAYIALIVVLVGGLVGYGPQQLWRTLTASNETAQCFGSRPIHPRNAPFSSRRQRVHSGKGGINRTLVKLNAAAAECRPGDCPKYARGTYWNAVRKYILARMRFHENYYKNYGEAGLTWIQDQYATIPHERAVRQIIERYKSGDFRLGPGGFKRSTLLLLNAGTRGFRPCSAV